MPKGVIETAQTTTPSNPPSGSNRLYFKNDNNLYMLNSAGAESQVNGGGGGAEPANQIVYGTGTGVDSSINFRYDNTIRKVDLNGVGPWIQVRPDDSATAYGNISIDVTDGVDFYGAGSFVDFSTNYADHWVIAPDGQFRNFWKTGALTIQTEPMGVTPGTPGNITVQAGSGTTDISGGSGASVFVYAGNATDGFGGDAEFGGGTGGAAGSGGGVLVFGGDGGATGNGGDVAVDGGTVGTIIGGTAKGGNVAISSGTNGDSSTGNNAHSEVTLTSFYQNSLLYPHYVMMGGIWTNIFAPVPGRTQGNGVGGFTQQYNNNFTTNSSTFVNVPGGVDNVVLYVPLNSAIGFTAHVTAKDTAANNAAYFTVTGVASKAGTEASLTVNSTTTAGGSTGTVAGWSVQAVADTTNGTLEFEVQADAGGTQTVAWSIYLTGSVVERT